jgi:hypothetical protein
MPLTNFVRNYQDLSTDTGFQYEFFCDRCGNGYQTQFEPSVISGVTDILDTAGSGIHWRKSAFSHMEKSA